MININTKLYPDEALQLISLLGGSDECRIVGGAVRNILMGIDVTDIDLATTHPPQDVQDILNKNEIRNIPTGLDHGTITAVINGKSFEITTLRSDVSTDGRHAQVAFSKSWDEDAKRRDFTVNALYVDENGNVFDPLGQGIDDVHGKKLHFIGNASTRIDEDVLRILRYYRFYAQYDFCELSPKDRNACKDNASKIISLSKERITQELLKILSAPYIVRALDVMYQDDILPDLLLVDRIDAVQNLALKQIEHDVVDSIALLLSFAVTLNVIDRYCILSNAQKKHIKSIESARAIVAEISDQAILLSIYKYGKNVTQQAILIDCDKPKDHMSFVDQSAIPVFPVTGKQLMSEGYSQGKNLGDELKRREEIWIASGFKAT